MEADIKEDVYGSVISLVASMLFSVNVVDVASAPPQGLQALMTVLILLCNLDRIGQDWTMRTIYLDWIGG